MTKKAALFIDGSNLFSSAKSVNFDLDYKKLLDYFKRDFEDNFLRAYYYTAVRTETTEKDPIRPLLDWLDYNGYTMVTKPVKEFVTDAGVKRRKGNMDIEMAVDALELAEHLDHAIFFTGDGDFRYAIEAIQRKGVRVVVVSTPELIADELRRQADHIIYLAELEDEIAK